MGSRIRENVTQLFECFCEVVKPQLGTDAWIIQKFPEIYKNEEILKSVPKFAYPCEFDNSVIQHFSFVLTNVDSKWTFGFCRHDPDSSTALVLLSFLPWHESFYKLLNCISDLIHNSESDLLWTFLNKVYTSKVPDPNGTLKVPLSNNSNSVFICQAPAQFQLPKIPENRNLTEYYSAVDCDNMIRVFASMLFERRIVFTSKKLYRLSACVQAANAIIYPMNWQHIFIPVLPAHLVDYLLAPMPYLIGVPNSLLDKVRRADVGDVVILDADNNTVESPFDDLAALPQDVVKQVRGDLKNCSGLLGDGVSRAFLRCLVRLIGGYRDALQLLQGQKITFDREAFVESRPAHLQPFLRGMLELQIFQQFIEERLAMLNAGLGFSDEFELEACIYGDKNSSKLKAQYKEWTYAMKKEGSAFLKSVKTRANPAVKSAVKTVKERSKDVGKAYKGIKTKLKGSSGNDEKASGSSRRAELNARRTSDITGTTTGYTALGPSSPEHADFEFSPINLDLMGDLQDVLFNKCSLSDSSMIRPSEGGATGSDDDVFLLGNQNQTKVKSTSCEDLIRLDSDSDFDPLAPTSLTNPLYYFSTDTHRDMDLLREYGLDFPAPTPPPKPPGQWAKFD
ncbi:DENN domain-containing protein 1B isoform X1 [Halyomorpha halys]|uniref:DENN domain-containing protein 1B isoform X1 n=1 Tax=Halyomorpha halys TaxID=286706 RepID=UPI0006D50E36|nr:DENN domain-containing protein 1B-like isoform X1 [Halyomorpha halys]